MSNDIFNILAPYYDQIMNRVQYDKWKQTLVATQKIMGIGEDRPVQHLDIACGTGTLIHRLSKHGWNSIGTDISPAMLYTAKDNYPDSQFLVSDMRFIPFRSHFDIISCLFDSINFLLDEEDIYRSINSMAFALKNEGVLYFDCVTEQMVKQYYNNTKWKENYKNFQAIWESAYNEDTKIATLSILIQGKGWSIVRQRLYPLEIYLSAIKEAGLTLLACVDAHTWNYPTPKTVRVDFVCSKEPSDTLINRFRELP